MKNLRTRVFGSAILIATFGLAFATSATAALGEKVTLDRSRMMVLNENFSIHETKSPGLSVWEYISNSGIVFAVTWKGNHHPDLSQYLGNYYKEYQAASQLSGKGRQGRLAHRVVDGPRVKVIKFGHMRSIQGKAYAQELLPEGVSPDEIR